MKKLYFLGIFLFLGLVTSGQTTPTGSSTEVGITEGQLSVSLSGAATYNIPIMVPPGINGVVPQVGLVYNSQEGNGMAGMAGIFRACLLLLEYLKPSFTMAL